MTTLMESISEIIDKTVEEYIEKVSDKFKIKKEELLLLWKSQESPRESSQESTQESTQESPKKPEKMFSQTCPYIFTKGANNGSVCGCKSIKGNVYCSKHKKYEGI